MLITLQASPLPKIKVSVPENYELRMPAISDTEEIGRLYFASYDPGVGCETEAEAIADIAQSFAGTYGELWLEASPLVIHDGSIVAVIQTVHSAPWPDVPKGPFVTEVFVDREHRRRGLARAGLLQAIAVLRDSGQNAASLRVMESNSSARLLYASLGFRTIP